MSGSTACATKPSRQRDRHRSYRGSRIAPWLLGVVVTIKLLQSVVSIFLGASVASSADGIPLDTYSPAGAQTVIALFSLDYVARSLVLYFVPIERTGAAGGLVVNQVLFALMVVGLVLSLRRGSDTQSA